MTDTAHLPFACTPIEDVPANPIRIAFRSGMSRSNDLNGGIEAKVPVGVVAGELRLGQEYFALPKYLAQGGAVFVDSGAFGAVKHGLDPDFNAVLQTYENIAESALDSGAANLDNLYVVAPDMVGNQERTLELLTQYKDRVNALITMGCKMIVALQNGPMNAMDNLNAIKAVLGTDRFVAGIPSCAKPMPVEQCATINHHSAHILGRVSKDADQIARIAALSKHNPNIILTADACWIRSRTPVIGKATSEMRKANEKKTGYRRPLRESVVSQLLTEDTEWAA